MQSARRVQSEEARGHLNNARVMSIAALQRQLSTSSGSNVELRTYFTQLCQSLGASMIADPDRLSIEVTVDDSIVEADVSVSLGLIVTELVINALKHAFPEERTGMIVIDYRSSGDDWTLSVTDNGIGMPTGSDAPKAGLGTGIVEALSIGLSNLKRRVPNPDDAARSEFSGLQQQVVGLAKDLRDLSHELHPGALEHVELLEALRGRCVEINGESGTRVDVKVADGWSEVADDIELCLYRVAQEGLRNITKHAHARTARISLARRNGQVVMRITDDGRGFQENGSNGQHGIGLLSMRERVRMLRGSFEVESSGRGTVATVAIPTGESH